MIKYVIHSKKWRDKLNGNTYHSVRVLNTQNNSLIAAPYQYGYGDQFMQSAQASLSRRMQWGFSGQHWDAWVYIFS